MAMADFLTSPRSPRPSAARTACLASAPGRLEVLGNHTDYNEGFVLSCAVGQRTRVKLAADPAAPGRGRLVSASFPGAEVDFALAEAASTSGDGPAWGRYARGVVAQLQARGVRVPGFSAEVSTDLPLSAGMSSSAAFEVALIHGLLHLAGAAMEPGEIARVGQAAESLAVGAHTGLMDQLTSCLGKAGHLVLSEYRGLTARQVPMPPGFAFVVVDSGAKHDLTTEYNDRRAACERAAAHLAAREPGVRTLRDATEAMLGRHAAGLGADLPFARHVVEENARVADAAALLARGDVAGFGRLLFASHESSVRNFANSSAGQDRLVALAKQDPRCLGARLSGGGFGGVTIHLVRSADAEAYAADLAQAATALDGREHWHTVAIPGDGPAVAGA